MLRINTKDGKTFKLDMDDEKQAAELVKLLSGEKMQQNITAVAVMKKYTRRHRCSNPNCKRTARLVCPHCGEIEDNGEFSYMGNQLAVIKPDTFDKVCFEAERSMIGDGKTVGGEKLVCFAGDVQLTVMAYAQQPTARVTLRRIGKRRFNPGGNR
jgi:hypothetical protein